MANKLINSKLLFTLGFFENEIDLLDDYGNVISKEIYKDENKNFIIDSLNNLKYENKTNIGELLNPFNFLAWLLISFKDIL